MIVIFIIISSSIRSSIDRLNHFILYLRTCWFIGLKSLECQEFCHVVGILLDGRRDAAKPNIPFQPSFARYKENGREFLTVARLKCTAIEVLMNVSDLRADYRLGKMLWLFKDKYLNYLKILMKSTGVLAGKD